MCLSTIYGVILNVDPEDSFVQFNVKKFGLFDVQGTFNAYSVTLDLEGSTIKRIEALVDSNSVFTDNSIRDRDLRSNDFLDSVNHSHISFYSEEPFDLSSKSIKGILKIKDISQFFTVPVDLDFKKDVRTNQNVLLISVKDFKLDRSKFGFSSFPFVISNEVLVNMNLIMKVYLEDF